MKQEPVAWVYPHGLKINLGDEDDWEGDYQITVTPEKEFDNQIPLYTAPKELSDEEIMQTAIEGGFYDCLIDWLSIPSREDEANLKHDLIRLCRAILKKASEK